MPFDHWIWLVPAFLIGACIGSFLNVVIYRVPLGMSVNEPKRSFCPKCKEPIPMWLNLPLVSWLWLRGRCAECGARIAFRYFGVELLTAVLFAVTWHVFRFEPQVILPLWVLMALLVSITFIDIEHLIIPTTMTWAGTAVGLVACLLYPRLPAMTGDEVGRLTGLLHGGIGWAVGFLGLWAVVELGKLAFGKRALKLEAATDWRIRESRDEQEPMCLVLGEEEIPWWDMFSRKTDKLVLECTEIQVDGKPAGQGVLTIRETEVVLPDGTERKFAELESLAGVATHAVIPREAMGFGDVHLLGMIGAFFGWSGVFFSLFAASIFAIVAAAIGRIGFGRQLPFGPFLAMGALTWAFGGWRIWEWYLNLLGPWGAP